MKKTTLLIAVCIAIFTTTYSFAQLVTSSADDGSNGTLRQEIADTPAGGTITFMPSVTTVNLNGELLIDKQLTITGAITLTTTIDANSLGRVFNVISGQLILNNLTLVNGLAIDGGAIYMTNATVTINNSIITNNTANGTSGSGGGIFNDVGGVLTVNDSQISFNIANRAGGGIEDNSGPGLGIILNNVNLDNNNVGVSPAIAAPGNGGGLHISGAGSVTISNGTANGNVAAREGGALWNGSVIMTVIGAAINGNEAQGPAADDGGGGIFNNGGTLIVQLGTAITNNSATGTLGSGGGIFNLTPGTFDVNGLTISGNTAMRAGGGIEIASASGESFTLNNVTLDGNTVFGPAPGNGGGLHISGPANVNYIGGSVINNIAFEGGGLWNGSGIMTISGTTLTGNIANGDLTGGGALFNNGGTLIVDASTILTGNSAMAATPGGRGGAIFNNTGGTLTLASGLSISENYASRAGGAIEDNSNGTLILNGVSLTGNSAGVDIGLGTMANPGNGGALHLSGTTNATITGFSTISNNLAALEGGGLWNNLGTMSIDVSFIDANVASGSGADDGGGGIFNNGGTLSVGNATILSNNIANGTSGSGGGILSIAGNVNITDALLGFNIANRAGGAIEIIDGTLTVSGNYNISDNNAGLAPAVASPGNGGAVHISGTANAMFTGGTFENNVAAREGGALWNNTGTMTVDSVTINANIASGNAADDGGAGIFNNGGTLIVQNGTMVTNNIANGTSGSGGGIFSIGGIVTVNGSTISNNIANRAGGGIELAGGSLNLVNTTLDTNNAGVTPAVASPGNGGGLHVTGSATTTITGGSTNNNIAANEGGGLWNGSGSMTIVDHIINGNTASGNDAIVAGAAGGGGIYNEGGTLDVSGASEIKNNIADGAQSTGGGILNAAGSLIANGIIIMNNTSNRAGGGIETNGGGAVTLTDVNLNSNETGVVTGAGAPGNGGGLHVSGNGAVTLTGGTTNNNIAANEGGGLWNGSGLMTIVDHTVNGNTASGNDTMVAGAAGGGGIFNEGGTLDLSGSTEITNNVADGAQSTGGGILNAAGTLMANGITIMNNTSNRAGGGIETNGGGPVTLIDVNLNSNETGVITGAGAPGNGGGLHVSGNSIINITGGTANLNTAASEGGGLWNGSGVMTVNGVTIDGNSALGAAADDGGAGIFNNGGTLNLLNGTMVSNNMSTGTSGSGGGLLSIAGAVTINNSTFDSNSANRAGGAIELIDGSLDFNNSVMSNNDVNGTAGTPAPGNGGGFHVTGISGTINVTTSTISGNSAFNDGGGLWNQNGTTMNVVNSALYDNYAAEGGAIYNNAGAMTNVMTSTISGNTASVSGGGLSNNGASLNLNAVTVVQNTAETGGGIDAVNNVTIKNSIIALNIADSGTDVSGIISSNNYNLIGMDDLNVFTAQSNDLEGVNPMVGPLQDNGGTTLTHQLLNGSLAFDAGDTGDNFDDQIGQPVFGASRDIGAYESQTALSINEFNAVAVLKIYPNPTKGEFNIVIGDTITGNVEVQIVSITGKLVQKLAIRNGVNNMNIRGMASGLYIVNINTEKGSSSHKLILD